MFKKKIKNFLFGHLGVKWTTKRQLMKIDAFGPKASTLRPTLNLHLSLLLEFVSKTTQNFFKNTLP